MKFKDRLDATERLIPLLNNYKNENAIVLAIPRGGIPMGCRIAEALNLPLDLLMTKKIGHPNNPEYAIGAVSLEGRLINESEDVYPIYLKTETNRLHQILRERYKKLMGDKKPLDVKDKILIIVDDGIATGYTLKAAITFLRAKKPKKIVVAVPVAPYDSALEIQDLVDDFICLHTPKYLFSISAFYDDFAPVTDKESAKWIQDLGD